MLSSSPLQNFMRAPSLDVMSKIRRLSSTGKPQEDFLYAVITEWEGSEELKAMLTAQKYFQNDAEIADKKRMVINRLGVVEEAENLSNVKLHHPWLRKLTRQKVAYILSNAVVASTTEDSAKPLVEELTNRIDKNFTRALQQYGLWAIVNKYSWMQVYYDSEGTLRYKRIPSEELVPFWRDSEHTELDGILRKYSLTEYQQNGDTEEIKKVEFWTTEGVWYYQMGEDGLIPDPMRYTDVGPNDAPGPEGHFYVKAQDGLKPGVWSKIPFICFKYNAEEQSLLQQIKTLVDEYDERTSGVADMIADVPNNIKVVTNYDGSDKGEFVHNLSTYRVAFLRENGGLDQIESNLNVNAVDSHLDRLRKDITEAASAVDTQQDDLGNASGVAIRYRYADLDLDCSAMATEFKAALERWAWFVAVDMEARGNGSYLDAPVDFEFEPAGVINEAEAITNVTASMSVLSRKTALDNHPWVDDTEAEMKLIDKETEQKQKQMDDMLGYGFKQPTTPNPDSQKEDALPPTT